MRAHGARLDAVARDGAVVVAKPLGLVWMVTPSYSLVAAGLKKALEDRADVRIVGDLPATGSPSCVVLVYDEGTQEGLLDGIGHVRERYPGVPLMVFALRLDLALAAAALKGGADGFVHAAMTPEQVARAVEVVHKGELAAPRQLLGYLLGQEEQAPELGDLSARQREVLGLVVEGMSNAEIAGRLYLSESTIKQHLRAAYKLMGVRNRTEAAASWRRFSRE